MKSEGVNKPLILKSNLFALDLNIVWGTIPNLNGRLQFHPFFLRTSLQAHPLHSIGFRS